MSAKLTDLQLLHELEPVVEKYRTGTWSYAQSPGTYTDWLSRGRTGRTTTRSAGRDWDPTRAKLDVAQVVMVVKATITEDTTCAVVSPRVAMNMEAHGAWGSGQPLGPLGDRHGIELRDWW